MRTSERFIKRVAIPVIATGVLLIILYYGFVLFRGTDESPEQGNDIAPPPIDAPANVTEEAPAAVVESLQRTLDELDTKAKALGDNGSVQRASAAAHDKVEQLAQANATDEPSWNANKAEAYELVQQYAKLLGETERSSGGAPAPNADSAARP